MFSPKRPHPPHLPKKTWKSLLIGLKREGRDSNGCDRGCIVLLITLTPYDADVRKSAFNCGRNDLAVHLSVIKRHRQSEKRRGRNIESRTRLRTLIKKARQAVESQNLDAALAQIRTVNRALDKAVSKGTITRNTAARWLSRLSRSARPAATT